LDEIVEMDLESGRMFLVEVEVDCQDLGVVVVKLDC